MKQERITELACMNKSNGFSKPGFYKESLKSCVYMDWDDSQMLMKILSGREIASQLTRSMGSISANDNNGFSGDHRKG